MLNILDKNYSQIKSYIERCGFAFEEAQENSCKRINVQHGISKCVVKVYATGTIQLQGGESRLKKALEEAKTLIEKEENIGELLPFDIERFPEILRERNVDPIIVRFIEESILTIKAGSTLGCAFLLGGASEKAILLLVDAYIKAIPDATMRDRLISKTSGKFISKVYDAFKDSWKTSINKPQGFGWSNDIEIKIEGIFQFCRICRNETGHPHLPPNLDKGILIANMAQFVKYIDDLYSMINFYKQNNVAF